MTPTFRRDSHYASYPHFGWIAVLGLAWALSGCGTPGASSGAQSSDQGAMMQKSSRASMAGPAPGPPSAAGGPAGHQAFGTLTESQPDRFLIKNATVTLETRDSRAAARRLLGWLRAAHGYVASMHETVDDVGARTVEVELRVPAVEFDGSMQQIDSLGKVLTKDVTAEDVTEEFIDSQARLRNLERTETRLLAHLNGSARLGDTLLVEKELNRVREEIERLEGRLRFLSHRVDYSTITVTLQEAARPHAITPPEEYSTGTVASSAMRSLVGFARTLWSALIWVLIWSVLWLPILLVSLHLYRRRKR